MTIVLNLYAGPGTGKSTTAAATFAKLKYMDVNCELVTEYAKDKVWEESFHTLNNQIYVFGKQHHRLFRLKDKVDVIVTDSPMVLGLIYGVDLSDTFRELVFEEYNKFNNVNVFLKRVKRYQPAGRMQNEEEAKVKDAEVKQLLLDNNIEHYDVTASPEAASKLLELILDKLASN